MSQKLFVIHGWTYSLDKWDDVLAELTKRGYEPIMLHVPGLSEPSNDIWDIPKYVEWLRDNIGAEEHPIVIGHSNGGRIAMAYDVAYPRHISHLFLLASAGIAHTDVKTTTKRKAAKHVAKLAKPVARGPLRKYAYRLIGANDYGNAAPNMQKTMQHVLAFDNVFKPSEVSAPTTIIWGGKDTATPLADGKKLEAQIQNVVGMHVFDGAGHSLQHQKPSEIATIINATLRDL